MRVLQITYNQQLGIREMIREIPEEQFVSEFFDEFVDLECGRHFHPENPQHVDWVRKRIAIQYFRGARFYGHFLGNDTASGFATVLIDPGLKGKNHFGHMSELLYLLVRDEYRSNGYGRTLMDHVEAKCRSAGVYCLYAATYARNDDSMMFYINRGFVPVAMHPDVYGPHDEGKCYLRKILKQDHREPSVGENAENRAAHP